LIRRLVIVVAALSAATSSNILIAQESTTEDYGGYFSFLPFHFSADANRRGTTDDGQGLAINYGRRVSENFSWEFQSFFGSINTAQGDQRDFENFGLGIDLTYWLTDPERAAPFLLFGAGIVRNDVLPKSGSENDLFGNLGFGFITGPLGRSEIRLRGEMRYIRDWYEVGAEGEKNDRRIGIGIQIPLGRRTVERVVEREVVRESVVREEVPAPLIDSDNDGVPDRIDQCPGTLAGLATNNVGCASASPQVVRLDNVNFELDSATLTPSATATLRRVTDALLGEPNLRAEIAGHTDSSGSDDYNLRLSQQRAESVMRFLVEQGIDPGRLVPRGYGETRPVANNSTAVGREFNRRVEFTVLN
jgi:OOP family OmpA-OmpF porin